MVVGSILTCHNCAHFGLPPSSGTIPALCVLPGTCRAFSFAPDIFEPFCPARFSQAERTEKMEINVNGNVTINVETEKVNTEQGNNPGIEVVKECAFQVNPEATLNELLEVLASNP